MLEFFQILAETAKGTSCKDYEVIINIVRGILGLIQFGIPVLLIVMGTIDLGKAVMSSDDKEIKGAVTKLTKRGLAAIAVFLVSALVMLVMNMVSGAGANEADAKAGFIACWDGKNNTNDDNKRTCMGPPAFCTNTGKTQECDNNTGKWISCP